MHTLLVDLNAGQVEPWVLVPVFELSNAFVMALHLNVVVVRLLENLVHGPSFEDRFEVIIVHPKNTVITTSIKTDLPFELISPAVGVIAPVAVPLTAAPRVPQLDEVNSVTGCVKYLLDAEEGVGVAWYNTLPLSQIFIVTLAHRAIHNIVLRIELKNLLKSVIILMVHVVSGRSGEISDSFGFAAGVTSLIGAV